MPSAITVCLLRPARPSLCMRHVDVDRSSWIWVPSAGGRLRSGSLSATHAWLILQLPGTLSRKAVVRSSVRWFDGEKPSCSGPEKVAVSARLHLPDFHPLYHLRASTYLHSIVHSCRIGPNSVRRTAPSSVDPRPDVVFNVVSACPCSQGHGTIILLQTRYRPRSGSSR